MQYSNIAMPTDALHSKIDLDSFSTISLEETNAKADMMERIDNKYIVDAVGLQNILEQLTGTYRLMSIDGRIGFTYSSRYYDDNYHCYFDHHQGRRRRHKIRIRHYVDSDLYFFELKLKGGRGQTKKFRVPCNSIEVESINPDSHHYQLVSQWYRENYDDPFDFKLQSSLIVDYSRFTLVNVNGGERVTVDSNIVFHNNDDGERWELGPNKFIVETKTSRGRGEVDSRFRSHGYQPQNKCSKYCIGLAITGRVSRYNRFKPVLRFLNNR